MKRKNSFRIPLFNSPITYASVVIVSFSVAFLGLLKMQLPTAVTAVFGAFFLASAVYAYTIIVEYRLQKKMDVRLSKNAVEYLLVEPIKAQMTRVISDWRDRKSVFPNQLEILDRQLEMLGNLCQVCEITDQTLESSVNELAIEVEQTKFGNVVLIPPTLRITVNRGFSEIKVAGLTIEDWKEKIAFEKSPKFTIAKS